MECLRRDPPASQHHVAAEHDGGLAGGHGALRLVHKADAEEMIHDSAVDRLRDLLKESKELE